MKKSKDRIYLVMDTSQGESEDEHFWMQYSTLTDAVGEYPGKEIFVAVPKSIGFYKLKTEKTKAIKIKKK